MPECPKTFANPPLSLSLSSFHGVFTFLTRGFPSDVRHTSGPSPQNAQNFTKIREIHTTEEKLRAQEERRIRRETSGRQAEMKEDNHRKYLCVFNETRNAGRNRQRSVSSSHPMPAQSPPEPVWGPIMDMTAFHRPHAIWVREARAACAIVREERTSAAVEAQRPDTSGEKRK